MERYRIYTENKSPDETPHLVAGIVIGAGINGCTIYTGTGYWKGQIERNLTVEILTVGNCYDTVRAIAETIKDRLAQEAVFVTAETVDAELV